MMCGCTFILLFSPLAGKAIRGGVHCAYMLYSRLLSSLNLSKFISEKTGFLEAVRSLDRLCVYVCVKIDRCSVHVYICVCLFLGTERAMGIICGGAKPIGVVVHSVEVCFKRFWGKKHPKAGYLMCIMMLW